MFKIKGLESLPFLNNVSVILSTSSITRITSFNAHMLEKYHV